jgi:hypothetical protein
VACRDLGLVSDEGRSVLGRLAKRGSSVHRVGNNEQKLAAKAGYSPAGMLTLLETFKALRKGQAELPSGKYPTLSERIAQAERLAKTSAQKQTPLRIRQSR